MTAGYVIKRGDGWYVTPEGCERSYTKLLQQARVFDTFEEAERERCGNEQIVPITQELQR